MAHPFGSSHHTCDAEYELREARSEIGRHHGLITDMREALEWSLVMAEQYIADNWSHDASDDDQLRLDRYKRLLNRQVS